jgi:hypothetical protein
MRKKMSLKILTKQKKVDKFNCPYTLNPYTGCKLIADEDLQPFTASFGCVCSAA